MSESFCAEGLAEESHHRAKIFRRSSWIRSNDGKDLDFSAIPRVTRCRANTGERLQLVGGSRPGASWSLLLNLLPACASCVSERPTGDSGINRCLQILKRTRRPFKERCPNDVKRAADLYAEGWTLRQIRAARPSARSVPNSTFPGPRGPSTSPGRRSRRPCRSAAAELGSVVVRLRHDNCCAAFGAGLGWFLGRESTRDELFITAGRRVTPKPVDEGCLAQDGRSVNDLPIGS
jgi:hypothetical protein